MTTVVRINKLNFKDNSAVVTPLLVSSDHRIRNVGMKHLKKLMLKRSGDTDDAFQMNDYLLIWPGLFSYMWMSETPQRKKNAIEKISHLIHSCTSYQGKILFVNTYFCIIKDGHIMMNHTNQCMMLLRRFLRQLVFTFINSEWNSEYMNKFREILHGAVRSTTDSLRNHFLEIFVEELFKTSKGKVPSEVLDIIIDSF